MEDAMRETPQINHVPQADDLDLPFQLPQVSTPIIQMQDIEHLPAMETRLSNKGTRIMPTLDSGERRDFAKEDEDALAALEQIERSMRE
jgi:hypothetical protein